MEMVELSDRLNDAEALIALQARQLKELEARQAKITLPDYSPQFEELKQLLSKQPVPSTPAGLAGQLEAIRATVSAIPRVLPVEHHHHVEDSARWFALGGLLLVLITAVSAGGCLSLYRENTRFSEHDVKYRLIRLYDPQVSLWADTVYRRDPKEVALHVGRLEEKQLLLRRAEELARQKQEEAAEAARKVEKLKDEVD